MPWQHLFSGSQELLLKPSAILFSTALPQAFNSSTAMANIHNTLRGFSNFLFIFFFSGGGGGGGGGFLNIGFIVQIYNIKGLMSRKNQEKIDFLIF